MPLMNIGFVGDSKVLGVSTGRKFRLASYSRERFLETCEMNIKNLDRTVRYASDSGFRFYRINSQLIPFASHPVCKAPWREVFAEPLREIGAFIRKSGMRISMHPDQFVVLNAREPQVVRAAVDELLYHAAVYTLLGLGREHKFQLHVGGIYGDKDESIRRFIRSYKELPEEVKRHLVIENDDRLYSVADCYRIYQETGVPILLDIFHHEMLNNGELVVEAVSLCRSTWQPEDGLPMIDYSSQAAGGRPGKHTDSIDMEHFAAFLKMLPSDDFDIMLEIKDKDVSGMKALEFLASP